MILALFAAALACGATPATTATIDAGERASLVMITMTPSGASLANASERVLRLADASLRAHSRAAVKSPEQLGIDASRLFDCELDRRLSCWVREARSTAADAPLYLLALSILQADDGSAELTALVLDLEKSSALLARGGDRAEVENQLFEAMLTQRARIEWEDDGALSALFDRLFTVDLAPRLKERGLLARPGSIDVAADTEGLLIALDGKTIGATRTEPTIVAGVAPGTRRLVFLDPQSGAELAARTVEVRSNDVAALSIAVRAPSRPLPMIALAGGGAIFAAGAVTGAVAFAGRADRVTPCAGAIDRDCGGSNALVPGVAVGVGLAVFGATWALGAQLSPDDDLYFWLSAAAGLVLGSSAAALGLTLGR